MISFSLEHVKPSPCFLVARARNMTETFVTEPQWKEIESTKKCKVPLNLIEVRSARGYKVRINTRQRYGFVLGASPHMQLIPESASLRPIEA